MLTSDECSINNGGCHKMAECDSGGLHVTCRCKRGYEGNGKDCTSECSVNNGGCHPEASCSINVVSDLRKKNVIVY